MMYSNRLAVAVKVDGKVLRENGSKVLLPFGSEYSLMFKNLNSTRAVISVEIDGSDVLSDSRLILNPNESMDLERFLNENSRKFKFIKRTNAIESHRGVGICDGLIRVSHQFEQRLAYNTWTPNLWNTPPMTGPVLFGISQSVANTVGPTWTNDAASINTTQLSSNTAQSSAVNLISSANSSYEPGITVEGSKSDQKFSTTYVGLLEPQSHSMVIELAGVDADTVSVTKPIMVKTKKVCPSCGSTFKSNFEYCSHDGTFLRTHT